KTIEEAAQVARKARNDKDPQNVAYGRRNAGSKNIFRGHKMALKSGSQSDPETAKFSGAQSDPTVPGAQRDPTIDISGGGGVRGGPSQKKCRGREAACRYCGELADTAVLIELYDCFFIHAECQEEWRSNGRGKN